MVMNYFLAPAGQKIDGPDQNVDGLCNFVLFILDLFIWTVSEYSLSCLVCLSLSVN